MIDRRMMHALEVERIRRSDMGIDLDGVHAIFQTSTFDAMLDGRYDGDVTFADRACGGHVLDCTVNDPAIQVDHTSHLHMELPPGVERVAHHDSAADHAEIEQMEG